MKNKGARLMVLTAALLGLPLVGVRLAGKAIRPYLQFPPITDSVQHAPFSWALFSIMAASLVLAGFLIARRTVLHRNKVIARTSFPWWGWAGLAGGVLTWIVAWSRIPALADVQQHTFVPLWLSYIVVVNALAYARSGRSMLTHETGYFLSLFPASAAFWWFFEFLNRFVQNWSYQGIESFGPAGYALFATMSFSTVLPAVLGTRDVLLTLFRSELSHGRRPAQPRKERFAPIFLLGIAGGGLLGLGLYPDFLFPLVWIAPGLIIVAVQALAGEETVFSPRNTAPLFASALAALVCGFFWELWNFHSLAKWIYHVPFVGRFHVFEMPLLGYAGYLPFGIECLVIGEAVRRAVLHSTGEIGPWLLRHAIALAVLVAITWTVPHRWCERDADAWFDGRPDLQRELAHNVERWVESDLKRADFRTGSSQFDGEWLFGTYLTAGFGFGQMAVADPTNRDNYVRLMGLCIERLTNKSLRAFDAEMWRSDPFETLDGNEDHGAYLGYLNLLLGFHRCLDSDSKYAELNDRITAALARRLERSRLFLLQSYPAEIYPVDNCAVFASIRLHAIATGTSDNGIFDRWIELSRTKLIDPKSGLYFQAVSPWNAKPTDAPRGSGTMLGLYFLSFADHRFSGELYDAAKKTLAGTLMNFGGVREYPRWVHGGRGDIDSGPVILGFGLSATGFGIAGTRIHDDRDYFRSLFGSAYLFGAPVGRGDHVDFVTGGPLGNAIMLAMLTASPDTIERARSR